MDSDGRNVKVEELNKRRIDAVKLRLSGVSIAETAKRIGLSQPTVIGALKAYRQGGWNAVPVAPRGRGVKKRSVGQFSGDNIKYLLQARNHQAGAAALVPGANTELASPSHLQRLEAESIHIMREVVAEAINPVMLYSIGKDSSVMLHLARKAFFPAPCDRAACTCPETSRWCRHGAAGKAAGWGKRPCAPDAASPRYPCRR